MGGQRAEKRFAHAVSEKHVAGFPGVSGFDLRAGAADFLQRPGEPRRIAGELNRGGIGQKFPLPAERGLDEPAKEYADRADDDQGQPQEHQRIPVPAAAREDQDPANHREAQDAEDDAHDAQIQTHVAIEDVAELVADDALQLIAVEQCHATARDADGGVARRVAGRKGVDAFFVVEHINLGDGHAGGDGHFLDHVPQLALIGMGRVGIDEPSAERFGDGTAALGQGGGFVEAADRRRRRACQARRRGKAWDPTGRVRAAGRQAAVWTGRRRKSADWRDKPTR